MQERRMNRTYIYIINIFRQDFDSIHRGRLLEDLLSLGIPKKLVRLVEVTTAGCRAGSKFTFTVFITTGVRQGDTLSSLLFDIVLEAVINKTELVDK